LRKTLKLNNPRPIAFIIASTNYGSMLINRYDYSSNQGINYGVGYQLLSTSSYDQEETSLAVQLLTTRKVNFGKGVIAIDCGANIGCHTISWAKEMHGWGEVIAFEAQERIFYALCGNITINNCFNAKAIFAAISSKSGEMLAPIPNYFNPSSFGSLELIKTSRTEHIGQDIDYSSENCSKIKVVSIDELDLNRLDFIKIDIEGMEMQALTGAEKSILKFKPQILIEKLKSNPEEIRHFLESFSYQIFDIGLNFLAIHLDDPALNNITQN